MLIRTTLGSPLHLLDNEGGAKSGYAGDHMTRVMMSEKALIAHVLHSAVWEFFDTSPEDIVSKYLARSAIGPEGILTLEADAQTDSETATVINETNGISLVRIDEPTKNAEVVPDGERDEVRGEIVDVATVVERASEHSLTRADESATDGALGQSLETTRVEGIDTALVTVRRERRTDLAIRVLTPANYYVRVSFEFELNMRGMKWEAGRANCGVARLMQSEEERAIPDNHFETVEPCYCICICLNPSSKRLCNTIAISGLDVVARHGNPAWKKGSLTQNRTAMICLGGPGRPEGGPYDGTVKLLHTVFSDNIPFKEKKRILESEFGLAVEPDLEKEICDMSNWEADIRKDTRDKTWKEADKKIEEVREEAEKKIEEVREETTRKVREETTRKVREETKKKSEAATLSRYMAKFKKSLAAAMDDLDMTGVDMATYQELIDQMNAEQNCPA